MSDKSMKGKKGYDPEWVDAIASHVVYSRDSGKSYEYQKNLRELFFEYRTEGLRSREALEKAKRVLASFET
jgi:hypothetical protein